MKILTFSRHDFNETLGKIKVQSFAERFPEAVDNFRGPWIEYMKYCAEVESGEVAPSFAENRSTVFLVELNRDTKGYPMVPEDVGNLINMKRIIRSFVTAHYRNDIHSNFFSTVVLIYSFSGFASGRTQDRVPWKQIKENTDYFVDPKYLPEPMDGVPQLDEPSEMKKEQIIRLLDYWKRPVHASELFRFSHVLVNSKTEETTTALYTDSFAGLYSLTSNGGDAGVDSGVPTTIQISETHPTCTPASDSFSGNPTQNLTHPTQNNLDPNIDPYLQGLSFPFRAPTSVTTPESLTGVPSASTTQNSLDPNIDPYLQGLSFPLRAPTSVTTPESLTGVPSAPITQNSLDPNIDPYLQGPLRAPTPVTTPESLTIVPSAPTPVIGPTQNNLDPNIGLVIGPTVNMTEQSNPSPRRRPKPKARKTKTNPTVSSDEPNPTSMQEDDLGRPKRLHKRKTDLYLEAEEKTERAKKKQKNRK